MANQRLGPPHDESSRVVASSSRSRRDEVVAIGARPWPYQGVVRTAGVLVLVAILGLSASACSKGSSATATSTTASVTTSTTAATTTTTSVEDAAIAGYRAFWAAYLRAADPMNPQHPDLAATAIDPELDQVRGAFLSRLAGHEVIRGTLEPHPHLEGTPTATSVTLMDCLTDDAHIFDANTGEQKDPPQTVTHLQRVQMTLVDGVWKVERVSQLSDGCTP